MSKPSSRQLADSVGKWVDGFNAALDRADTRAVTRNFVDDSHWRDVLATGWTFGNWHGSEDIGLALAKALKRCRPRNFRLAADRMPPRRVRRAGIQVVEAIISFETDAGQCDGVLRLVDAPDSWGGLKAWILLTALSEINGHGEQIGPRRTGGEAFSRAWGGENWLDLRKKEMAYDDRDPAVLIVGAGQAGLAIAARLKALAVDALVIEKHDQIGDNWRKRYHSLVLHNEADVNHLPYIPFPPTCPVYIPKDKVASWFRTYAENMDLNVWTGTALSSGTYNEASGRWVVEVQRSNGTGRTLHPRHLIFATGVSGIPVYPDVPGIEDFGGVLVHSGHYTDGKAWAGKRAVVLGSGNSGHDVAQDLYAAGAAVTMVQRSATNIVSLKQAQRVYSLYGEGPSLEDCDLLTLAMPYPALVKSYQLLTADMAEQDKPLLDRLAQRGFRIDFGTDGTGYQMKYLRRGGGYYFNVGCSDLIADDEIDLVQFNEIERIVPEGVRLKDGRIMFADLLVAATGYKNQQDVVRLHLGDDIADRIGPVWGYGGDGELRNMYQRTPQPGLWFIAGSFAQCRIYSKYLGLQIKASEVGLIDALPQTSSPGA